MSVFIKTLQELRKARMMARPRRIAPGSVPGSINIRENALPPTITVFSYNTETFTERKVNTILEIKDLLDQNKDMVNWIDVKGLGDKKFLEDLGELFNIHRLQMEDVVNSYQRPRFEEYNKQLFVISRMLYKRDNQLINEQLSIFAGDNYLLSLQEFYEDRLDPVRERIRQCKGYVREKGPDYLMYALMDAVTDHIFPILEQLGERLDDLEEEILIRPRKFSMFKIQQLKRELIVLRRAVWPERDKLTEMMRNNNSIIQEGTKIYVRDLYDHCIQILDLIESYKEVTSSLMDIYLSSVSNKMNEVMKVLTVISTIFIPLTFIVGVYGMNFSYIHPSTGKIMKWNMPELYSPYGYLSILGLMFLIVIVQLFIFYKKGWLTNRR